MFKERFNKLCAAKGMSPNAVCSSIGLSNSAYSKWTEDTIPRPTVLLKLSEFFGVSVAYLKGEEETVAPKPDTPSLSLNDLSQQEQTLIKLFRETTEEGRLEMIAAFMTIAKNHEFRTIYRAAYSTDYRAPTIENRTAIDIDKLKSAKPVTSSEDL